MVLVACYRLLQLRKIYLDTTYYKDVFLVQPKTTGSASAGKTLLPTRSPAEAVSFSGNLLKRLSCRPRYNFYAVVQLKRIYEPPRPSDGYRILVDRLWPRAVSKQRAHIALWLKEIGPSTPLRKWFGHDPQRWPEFQRRYREELRDQSDLLAQIEKLENEHGTVTLVYSARDEKHNQAIVLRDLLGSRGSHPTERGRAAKKGGA